MSNGKHKTLSDFKEYCHLEHDGETLYEAVKRDVIKGLSVNEVVSILKEVGITMEMGRNEILQKLKEVLREKEGPIAKLAMGESKRQEEKLASKDYESVLMSLGTAQEVIQERIGIMLKEVQTSAAALFRSQIEKVIDVLITKWE
jgi:hypothetical protein